MFAPKSSELEQKHELSFHEIQEQLGSILSILYLKKLLNHYIIKWQRQIAVDFLVCKSYMTS